MTHRPPISQSDHPTILPKTSFTAALLGNPNTGKSTLFGALTGMSQKTGNYPGVTVTKHTGRFNHGDESFELNDLPGTYSLAPRTPDEMLTINVLMGNGPEHAPPDVIVCVVDASNLERNLFLISQILELHRPTVIALNMMDVADRNGITIDIPKLSQALGVPVVGLQANRRVGLERLKQEIADASKQCPPRLHDPFSGEMAQRIARLAESSDGGKDVSRFVLTRMLFDTDGYMVEQMRSTVSEELLASIESEQQQMKSAGTFAESESHARYDWIQKQLSDIVMIDDARNRSLTAAIDRWLTHPVIGMIIAIVMMTLLFQLVFWAAGPASSSIEWLKNVAAGGIDRIFIGLTGQADGALHSLLVDGLIEGVGGVLVFLPQIMLLFLVLAVLEDTGYLARLAFLMDRYLARMGLSGITIIPLLSSFACAIPGIMATRVIENDRERLITILIAPLMSCSARIPVYTLMIAAFVPATSRYGLGLQGLTMLAMYGVGVVVAIAVAWLLKKTMLVTGSSSFVMELPSYQIPRLRNIWLKVYQGGASFVKDAGTIIVVATIIVWAASYFPRDVASLPAGWQDRESELVAALENTEVPSPESDEWERELLIVSNQIKQHHLKNSYLGRAGKLIEPVVAPLGWDWRIGSAAIASFPAREVLVPTMGILFGLGEDVDEQSSKLKTSLQNATWGDSDRKLFSFPVALSIMVFFALCAQCSSTLAVIKRETNSWKWPIFTFSYMTILAYVAAFLTFQLSRWIMG